MNGILLGRFPVESPEWHAARAKGIGGSEIAAMLGLSKWESPFSLWHRKAGTIGPQPENEEMSWGKRLESAIAGKFCEDHPELQALIGGVYANAERPWQIASPDLLLTVPCGCGLVCECDTDPVATTVLEVKTALFADEWGPSGTDDIPIYYRTQVMWYMDTLGFPSAHVAVLISGHDYREYVIEYDADEATMMRTRARAFLDSIEDGNEPALDGTTQTYEALKELHPDIDPQDIEIPAPIAVDYIVTRADLDAAKTAAQLAANELIAHMGSARRATYDGRPLATRQARGNGFPYLVAARHLALPTAKDAA